MTTNSTAELLAIWIVRRKNGIPMFRKKKIPVIHNTVMLKYSPLLEPACVIVCIGFMSPLLHTKKEKRVIEKKYQIKTMNKKGLRNYVTYKANEDFNGEMNQICAGV